MNKTYITKKSNVEYKNYMLANYPQIYLESDNLTSFSNTLLHDYNNLFYLSGH